ncbi:hypothetical protein FKM82_025786 [Ascaphus truei]
MKVVSVPWRENLLWFSSLPSGCVSIQVQKFSLCLVSSSAVSSGRAQDCYESQRQSLLSLPSSALSHS